MLEIRMLHDATDKFVDRIVNHINAIYEEFENGLWLQGALRTSPAEIVELIAAEQLVIAELDGDFVGCVRVQKLPENVAEFGMLAVTPGHHGQGIGRELVRFAEQHSKDNGSASMQLEVLMPQTWSHPIKDALIVWYTRIGYRLVRQKTANQDAFPAAHLLSTPCDFHVYRKDLSA